MMEPSNEDMSTELGDTDYLKQTLNTPSEPGETGISKGAAGPLSGGQRPEPRLYSQSINEFQPYQKSTQDEERPLMSEESPEHKPTSTLTGTYVHNVFEVERTQARSDLSNKAQARKPLQRQTEVDDSVPTESRNTRATRGAGLLDSKYKLNREDYKFRSLEVPSITIKIESADEDTRCRHRSSSSVFTGDPRTPWDHEEPPPQEGPKMQTFLSPSGQTYVQLSTTGRQLVTRSVGRASGNRLKSSYSLDAQREDVGDKNMSRSLNTLVTCNGQITRTQPVVMDKLISSSMMRLEKMAKQRRSSWAPETYTRSSQGKIEGEYTSSTLSCETECPLPFVF
ncbi:phosphatidylinositol 3,4,5-trisphosphate 3-phosphatase TPTE2 [Biomphalaria glabrata]|nr:phosphatidylinositol 3,4,5-trisphosphate 3-phosphatase TPTE2 [Biomphalaria glabrata]